jgi:hypothetical protein
MAVTMKNGMFWDVMPCGFVRADILVFIRSMLQLLITATIVPSLPILVTLMMHAIRSSKTSVLTTATLHNIPEDGIHLKKCCVCQQPTIYN